MGVNKFGSDYKFVATIPMNVINDWLKEAGVAWDDTHARADIMKKKILSGEVDRMVAWKGKY